MFFTRLFVGNKKRINACSFYNGLRLKYFLIIVAVLAFSASSISLSMDIFRAIDDNNIDRVIELIEKDSFEVNQTNSDGETPLHVACDKGCLEVVKKLLERKDIDVNKVAESGDYKGGTPFFIAFS